MLDIVQILAYINGFMYIIVLKSFYQGVQKTSIGQGCVIRKKNRLKSYHTPMIRSFIICEELNMVQFMLRW